MANLFKGVTIVNYDSRIQCDQMARLFSICPFTSMKTCPMAYKISQSRPKFYQIGNQPSKIAQDFDILPNGKISPNLVTV